MYLSRPQVVDGDLFLSSLVTLSVVIRIIRQKINAFKYFSGVCKLTSPDNPTYFKARNVSISFF